MTDNILQLPKVKRRATESKGPLEIVYSDIQGCRHRHIEVCDRLAEVTCADCKVKLNPIWVLMNFAIEDRMLVDRWATMKAEIQLMEGRTRVKCRHCDKFTPVHARATATEVMQLAADIKKSELT